MKVDHISVYLIATSLLIERASSFADSYRNHQRSFRSSPVIAAVRSGLDDATVGRVEEHHTVVAQTLLVDSHDVTNSKANFLQKKNHYHHLSRRPYVELIEPETGCQVILLGCFHGSQSSAADVRDCLNDNNQQPATDIVALELCASRFASLRRDYLATKESGNSLQSKQSTKTKASTNMADDKVDADDTDLLDRNSRQQPRKSWLERYSEMILKMSATRGVSAALAAALLGGVSGLQVTLSGLEPGLEFTTALDIAVSQSKEESDSHTMDIVLADQNVDETLNKVGNLLSVSLNLWKDCWQKGWDESFGKESDALSVALFGNMHVKQIHGDDSQVSLPAFLTRSRAALQDLARLAVPPFCFLQFLNFVVWQSLGDSSAMVDPTFVTIAPSLSVTTTSLIMWINTFLSVGLGYLSIALPATQAILRERDDYLARGIATACRLAVQKKRARMVTTHTSSQEGSLLLPPQSPVTKISKEWVEQPTGRVVAVLGLLHVNGVAQRLLMKQAKPEDEQDRLI